MTSATVEKTKPPIAGYDYGSEHVQRSPVTLEELRQLEQSVGWTDGDTAVLKRVGELIEPDVESIVDAWRSVIGAQPHLGRWFMGAEGQPDEEYKAKVKRRFVQWVRDVCTRSHDQAWLDYQEEIGKRHTPIKKNLTDGAATPNVVPLRYLIGFSAIVITTMRAFVEKKGIDEKETNRFMEAWSRAVLLEIALWTRPYAQNGLW